jgi:RNA polymerase sigma-70 factor (ECF subfamily)
MSLLLDSRTRLTLLHRLRQPNDPAAWRDFVQSYAPKIQAWCHRWGLQPADAEDVAQNVLLQMARQMQSFEYRPGGSFRKWLKTVTYRAWCDFQTARQRAPQASGHPDVQEMLDSVAAREDFLSDLTKDSDRDLLHTALLMVSEKVQPRHFQVFRLMALEGMSGLEVAEHLDMKPGNVFVIRGRVQKLIMDTVRRLDEEGEAALARAS